MNDPGSKYILDVRFSRTVYFELGLSPMDSQAGAVFQLGRYILRENDENAKSCRPILPGWKIIDYKRSLENTI